MRADRQQQILELIAENGQITVAQIVDRFGVSEMTARRDLAELAQDGLLRRVHGGAISSLGRSYEPPYPLRTNKSFAAKQAIGRRLPRLLMTVTASHLMSAPPPSKSPAASPASST